MQSPPEHVPKLQDAALFSSRLGMIIGIWSLIAPWFFMDSPMHMLASVIGLVVSGVALHDAKQAKSANSRRMAIVGLITSGIGFAIVVAVLASVISGFRREEVQFGCLYNTKLISMAMRQYTSDYDDKIPPAEKWQPALLAYLPTKKREDKVSELPYCLSAKEKRFSYGMNNAMSGIAMHDIRTPASTVFVFDSSLPIPSASGGRETVDFRHNVGVVNVANIGFIDGHSKAAIATNADNPNFTTIDQLRWKP